MDRQTFIDHYIIRHTRRKMKMKTIQRLVREANVLYDVTRTETTERSANE